VRRRPEPEARPARGPAPDVLSYRLLIEYDGSRFQGWQKQGPRQTAQGVRTVSGALERVLQEAGLQVLSLGGSGRTDAGVHALGQVAHLRLAPGSKATPRDIQMVLDQGLPADVAVRSVLPCSPRFHARHEALSRSYMYQISLRRSAFAKPYVWWVKGRLDLRELQAAWSAFQGNWDMTSFADLEPGEDPRCQILGAEFAQSGDLVLLRATAGHFLRRQVRRMVGAAVLCAQGRERSERLAQDLRLPSGDAGLFWGAHAAPASGLFLERVQYPGDPEPGPVQPVVPVF
jgi:tRNA pseudouridine38-40 synthase